MHSTSELDELFRILNSIKGFKLNNHSGATQQQDAKQHQALKVNYFDDNATGQNEEPKPEDEEQTIQFSKDNQIPPSQTFPADTNVARNPLESLKSDTGHNSR